MIVEKKLFLLFSADVIDSTAMKARMAGKSDGWLPLFKRFYTAFPKFLVAKSKSFKLWKYVGDEILFYVEINDQDEIVKHVMFFKETLEHWNNREYEKVNNVEYKDEPYTYLKGCIWLAQTPDIDKELEMNYSILNLSLKDFAGPSVDCGFRIAKFSSLSHMMISIDVLCACYKDSNLSFYFLNSEYLKGVYDGKIKYPLFFILMKDGDSDDVYLREKLTAQGIEKYLAEFYKQFNFLPYENIVKRIDDEYFRYFKFGYNFIKNLISDSSLNSMEEEAINEDRQNHIREMKKWFLERYEDPAENCPYESKEGGYFYLHGGPYNAEEELSTEFSNRYSEEEIQEAAEELENEYSVYDWEMIDSPYGDD